MRDEAAPAEAVRAGQHDRVVQHFEAYGTLIILQQLLARRSGLLLCMVTVCLDSVPHGCASGLGIHVAGTVPFTRHTNLEGDLRLRRERRQFWGREEVLLAEQLHCPSRRHRDWCQPLRQLSVALLA